MSKVSQSRGRKLLWTCTGLIVCAGVLQASRAYLSSSTRGLPYRDSFTGHHAAEWKALGGAWELHDGAMQNDSDERGGKLITGSASWRNYSIEADVKLLAPDGDAGLVIRSSDEEVGTDAYSGYYAGLRALNDSLVLGRAGHGWVEDNLTVEPGRIKTGQWYHIKLLAFDCSVVASASLLESGSTDVISVRDDNCLTSGRAGLRSYRSGGIWRNVVIQPATESDRIVMEGSHPHGVASSFHRFSHYDFTAFSALAPRVDPYADHAHSETQPISSLRLNFSPKPSTATIRGSVILISPMLYIQSATGGVAVPHPSSAPSLRIGDQVEVSGQAVAGDFSLSLQRAIVQTLWEDTPIPPVTVSADQAATGAFDATLVEVEGQLTGKRAGSNNTLILDLSSGTQSFSAILSQGRGDDLFERIKPNSILRLRGVCLADPAFTETLTPFTVLLRSSDDIDILRGPPLWSTSHVAALISAIMAIALVVNLLYHRVERWKLRAILEERERMAYEIHDTLAQSFAGIGFQLEAIRASAPDSMPLLHQQLDLASDLVRHSHKEARHSVTALSPALSEAGDLLSLLENSARQMVKGGTIKVVTSSSGEVSPLPLRVSDTLYHIGLEAIANSVRHAHPQSLTISLHFDTGHVCLLIADDGQGFNPGGGLGNFGIRGMRRRAAAISAQLQIESRPGEGSRVCVVASLPPKITLPSLPALLWKWSKEHVLHVEPARTANTYPNR